MRSPRFTRRLNHPAHLFLMKKPVLLVIVFALLAVIAAAVFLISDGPAPVADAAKVTTETQPKTAAPSSRDVVPKAASSEGKSGATSVSMSFERRQNLERAGFAAGKDLDAALLELAGITAPNERAAFIRGLFENLSTGDRTVAMNALKKLKDNDRATAAMSLVDSWQPEARTRFQRDGRVEGMLGFALLDKDPMLAAEWARNVLDGDGSKQLLSRAVEEIARQNPQEALAMGKDLTGTERTDFLRRIAQGWAQTKPDDALAWAGQEADPAVRATLTASALSGMAANDPAAAASHLDSLAPGDERNRVIDRIVRGFSGKDIPAAEQFVASMKDANEQQSAQRALDQFAPYGIGAQIRPSRDGGWTVQGVTEGGNGAQAGLQQNQKIVGVMIDGVMTATNGGDFRQIGQAIRGGANGKTTLSVLPEGSTTPQIVTVASTRSADNQGGFGGPGGGPPGGNNRGGGRGRGQ